MRTRLGLAILTSIALIGIAAIATAAPAAKPTPVPNAAPDFSSFNFLLGTWHCKQKIDRPGNRRETDVYTMAYDGWFLRNHFDSPPFDVFRTRHEIGDAWTTYDPTIKKWVGEVNDNFGGYGLTTSPGWSGNSITWMGSNPDGSTSRDTFTKVSDTTTTDKSWLKKPNGSWKVTETSVCTKS